MIMKNKKYFAIFLAIFAIGAGLLFAAPSTALAQYGIEETAGTAELNKGNTSVEQIIGTVIRGALGLVGVIFLILMIYSGYLWMIARGDESKVEHSLDTIKAAIIGIIIVALAYAITDFVINQVLTKNPASTPPASSP